MDVLGSVCTTTMVDGRPFGLEMRCAGGDQRGGSKVKKL